MKKWLTIVGFGFGLVASAQQPKCEQALAQVNTDSLVFFVNAVTGRQPVIIAGVQQTIRSRHMSHPGNNLAAEYLKQTVISYDFSVEDLPFSATGRNIVAYKSGTTDSKRAYLLGAHYDCVGNATMDFEGADDNASGVAALLETARVMQHETFPYTVILAFWDEEETGLTGSLAFAPDGPAGYWDVKASVNLDMIGYDGNGDSLAMIHSFSSGYSDVLASKLVEVNRLYQTGLNIRIKNPGDNATDHYSFWLKGGTAVGLTEDYDNDFSPHWHQMSDSLGNMSISYFTRMSRLACAAICEITETGNYVSLDELEVPVFFTVFPNPVTGVVQLPNTFDWQHGVLGVFNIMGEQVSGFTLEGNAVNLTNLPAGWYTLRFQSGKTVALTRLIKQ